ncbi:FAD-dependent oxidoreductase [Carboxylicivirga taeanensis]|uniref:FAD-dependent oxidoreductase n=1 Tax=Carboxylicivirga taeanensis TaxID=1416875 RepID=UPI003F6E3556
MKSFLKIILLFALVACAPNKPGDTVIVIGGGASGVAASVQAARQGANVVLIEKSDWLGGMLTSAGVSAVDGNYNLPSGFFGEFRDSLAANYGGLDSLKTGWVSHVLFEPSVGNRILKQIVAAESKIEVLYQTEWKQVTKQEDVYEVTVEKDGKVSVISGKVLIDATELGDVAAALNVPYDIGMESKYDTNESIAPEKANDIIQDLTYVAILKDYGRDMSIEQPKGYDPKDFACSCINEHCINPKEPERMWSKEMLITYGQLPNNKYMINWPIDGNDYYINTIDMSDAEREEAYQLAKDFTMKFVYFIQHELGFKNLYLADDEFPTEDLMPLIPYHRESRRIKGKVRFNLNDIVEPYKQENKLYRTCIAVGDYPVDHHHARYSGWSELPNLYFYAIPSYGLPMGTILPKSVDNFIVAEKSISVSNLVNGTTRLQPVVLQIGQAAGALAALAVNENMNVGDVPVRTLQNTLLDSKCYLLPYLDVQLDHPWFKSLQRIGSTGILKGEGKNVDWSNQTWINADSLLLASHLSDLNDVYPSVKFNGETDNSVSWKEALQLIDNISDAEGITLTSSQKEEVFSLLNVKEGFSFNTPIKRGEFAVLVDYLLDPFNRKAVGIDGGFIN